MKKNCLIAGILVSVVLLVGCTAKEEPTSEVIVTENTEQLSEVSEEELSFEEKVEEEESLSEEIENDTNLYEDFLSGEGKLYFDQYMHYDYDTPIFDTQRGYSLTEIVAVFREGYHYRIEEAPQIRYTYLDCGNDGIKELAVQFYGMNIYDIDDDSTLVYIVKEKDGQLQLCYLYETWARSSASLNEFGYYISGGSSGASSHSEEAGVVDADGIFHFLYNSSFESDLYLLGMDPLLEEVVRLATEKITDGEFYICTTTFEPLYEHGNDTNAEKYFSYTESDAETNALYVSIFEEADVVLYTSEEITAKIVDKEIALGVTEEIRQGNELVWTDIN